MTEITMQFTKRVTSALREGISGWFIKGVYATIAGIQRLQSKGYNEALKEITMQFTKRVTSALGEGISGWFIKGVYATIAGI